MFLVFLLGVFGEAELQIANKIIMFITCQV
jgi:hypothetical protein